MINREYLYTERGEIVFCDQSRHGQFCIQQSLGSGQADRDDGLGFEQLDLLSKVMDACLNFGFCGPAVLWRPAPDDISDPAVLGVDSSRSDHAA